MKTTNKIRYGILGVIVAAMILSCAQPEGAVLAGGSAEKGSVVLTVSTGSGAGSTLKTIIPEDPAFSSYDVVFTKSGSTTTSNPEEKTDGVDEEDGHTYELEVGDWKVTVSAYRKFTPTGGNETTYKAAEGSKEFEVLAGHTELINVSITPIPIGTTGAPKGIFSYNVSYPSGAAGTLTLTPDQGQATDYLLSSGTTAAAGSVERDSGYYRLSIVLTSGSLSTGVLDEVHIYSGLESKAEFEFTPEDFTETVYLAGTLATLPAGASVGTDSTDYTITVYSKYDTENGYDGEVSGKSSTVQANGAWIVGVPAGGFNIGSDTLYIDAEFKGTDGTKVYKGNGDTGGPVAEEGTRGIELSDTTPPDGVTGLKAEVEAGKVTLTWTDPTDSDLDHIEITWVPDGETPVEVAPGDETYAAEDLVNGITYKFTVTAVDTAGNGSKTEMEVEATPVIDWTATVDGTTGSETSKNISFTFDEDVSGLTANDITISGTGVTKGALSGSGKNWTLGITVSAETSVSLSLPDPKFDPDSKNVDVHKDSTAPSPVTSLKAEPGYQQVTLTWTDPTDSDLDYIKITRTPNGETPVKVDPKAGTYTATGLTYGTPYTFTVKAVDKDGNESTGETATAIPGTVPVDAVNDLTTAIAAAKKYTQDHVGDGEEGVVLLTEAFYTAANTAGTALIIDAGETDNDTLYTIRGLGKTGTALTVGILLANDNVTLDGVKIAVTDPTKAAITQGVVSPQTADSVKRYTAAVTIGRLKNLADFFLTGDDLASNSVTVQNCDISYAKSSDGGYLFNAGIYVCGSRPDDAPQNICIIDNTVTSAGTGTAAAQAVVIAHYDPSIVITGNTLSSSTGDAATVNSPASALFLSINPNKIADMAAPQISGNTLDGKNIDFYVNIYSTGDYAGVPALFASKFGTYYSTWVTDMASSFYRQLYTALIGQAKATGYAGLFFMALGGDAGSYDGYCFVYEAWEKSAGVVTAVDYWGATILESGAAAAYNAGSGATKYDTDAAAADSGTGYDGRTKAGYRGRITLSGSVKSYGSFKFHPSDTTAQGDYKYTVGIPQ